MKGGKTADSVVIGLDDQVFINDSRRTTIRRYWSQGAQLDRNDSLRQPGERNDQGETGIHTHENVLNQLTRKGRRAAIEQIERS